MLGLIRSCTCWSHSLSLACADVLFKLDQVWVIGYALKSYWLYPVCIVVSSIVDLYDPGRCDPFFLRQSALSIHSIGRVDVWYLA